MADHRVILGMSWKTLVEEEHGGRAHDGRIGLAAQARIRRHRCGSGARHRTGRSVLPRWRARHRAKSPRERVSRAATEAPPRSPAAQAPPPAVTASTAAATARSTPCLHRIAVAQTRLDPKATPSSCPARFREAGHPRTQDRRGQHETRSTPWTQAPPLRRRLPTATRWAEYALPPQRT